MPEIGEQKFLSANFIEVEQRSFPGWGRLGWGEVYSKI